MCHVCDRLGITQEQKREEEYLELIAQGKPVPKAPRKVLALQPRPRTKVVVEPAPSHDGAPSFAAYEVPLTLLAADPDSADGYSNSPPNQDPEKYRPKFGIRIYDTTANATADGAAPLARRISELTYERRYTSTTANDRAATCIAHNEAERGVRLPITDATIAASWFIVEDFEGYNCNKRIFVINDLKDSWEDALGDDEEDWLSRSVRGHFLSVSYDRRFYNSDDEELEREGKPTEFFAPERSLELLGATLSYFRDKVREFYISHFIPDGVLDMELALARAAAARVEVPRLVVIPLRRDGHKY
ncbi:hypothetical protein C8A00DRAFT_43862 [Chaetomidium leptoderma]|uniref:Uncharacterized protein n=1 Tax=Chaetomidium leptoderma TaxID=669021 RepID=A0AAN6VKF8_9PEZI|nr:hypothetical protein C8A00DRAFT_43862 [Chaetomidium leptoderma]